MIKISNRFMIEHTTVQIFAPDECFGPGICVGFAYIECFSLGVKTMETCGLACLTNNCKSFGRMKDRLLSQLGWQRRRLSYQCCDGEEDPDNY